MTDIPGRYISDIGAPTAGAGWRKWYVLGVLIVAYIFAFIDRQIISLLVEPLKHDLALSDTQISLLQGFSFAIFLASVGLPVGWLIDRGSRVHIAAAGVAAWSLMTACSGLATSFGMLLICRIGVGAGESTLTPAAHSIIADSFPKKRLGLALGLFGTGTFWGLGAAYLIGSAVLGLVARTDITVPLLGTLRSWQAVFLAVGLPGLVVSLWVASLREPPRRQAHERPQFGALLHYFKRHRASILLVNLCLAFAAMTAYSASAWVPSFLIRSFGWTAVEAGARFGPLVMVFGVLGSLAGGCLADVAAKRVAGGRVLVMACAACLGAPFAALAPIQADPRATFFLLAAVIFFSTMAIGIGPSAQQAIAPDRMRGAVSAFGVLVVNVIGLGLGPTAIALVTDYVFHDPLKLRNSLSCLTPLMLLISALLGFAALKFYRASIAATTSGVIGAEHSKP